MRWYSISIAAVVIALLLGVFLPGQKTTHLSFTEIFEQGDVLDGERIVLAGRYDPYPHPIVGNRKFLYDDKHNRVELTGVSLYNTTSGVYMVIGIYHHTALPSIAVEEMQRIS